MCAVLVAWFRIMAAFQWCEQEEKKSGRGQANREPMFSDSLSVNDVQKKRYTVNTKNTLNEKACILSYVV